MAKKILIMGLPGSGKTFLAKKLAKILKADWLNADIIRGKYNDWDFSRKGILRQVMRMKMLSAQSKKKYLIADFVCPLKEQIKIFKPHKIIWMDTIKKSRFADMNKIFKRPRYYHLRITEKNININLIKSLDLIKGYKWHNKKPTVLMLGRYQPWHYGHRQIFEKAVARVGQVIIYVKDVHQIGDNPFSFKKVKKFIVQDLKDFKNRFKVYLAANITNVFYGRKVGYKIEKIKLSSKIENISATKIRKKLRKNKKIK